VPSKKKKSKKKNSRPAWVKVVKSCLKNKKKRTKENKTKTWSRGSSDRRLG
jgi:hypothetical protein